MALGREARRGAAGLGLVVEEAPLPEHARGGELDLHGLLPPQELGDARGLCVVWWWLFLGGGGVVRKGFGERAGAGLGMWRGMMMDGPRDIPTRG